MLNSSVGNMYEFVTHTWNTVKGECPHVCTYCYMHRWGKQKPVRFDHSELKTDLGTGNFIFVGSSCDMWAKSIPSEWITKTLDHCKKFDNQYLFQTKNPERFYDVHLPENTHLCVTLETNKVYSNIMKNSPDPIDRVDWMSRMDIRPFITIEPIMDFDLERFVSFIKICDPLQVNIGADSGNNHLPEPPEDKIRELISAIQGFTKVVLKKNLNRLLKKESR